MSTIEPIRQEPPAAPWWARPYGRDPVWVWILSVIIVLLLLAGVSAAIVIGARSYFAFAPGSAPRLTANPECRARRAGAALALPDGTPCVRISVPAQDGHPLQGSVYMVTTLVGRASPGQYILSKLGLLHTFHDGTELVPAHQVLGATPASQLACQSAQDMQGATSVSSVVALRRLGCQVTQTDLGAQVFQVAPDSPASAAGLRCNDLVVAVNGRPVRTSNDFVATVQAGVPGDVLRVTIERVGPGGQPQTETLSVRLGKTPGSAGSARVGAPFLGVVSITRTTYAFPFSVSIEVGDIGGPSAGLALTLAILDVLSSGDLTGGHQVAATGTMGLDGTVGDVGGVPQKAVAVRKAGAQVFFVPADQFKAAESQAGSMKVYPVNTLQEALNDLQALGGQVPPPSG